MKKKSYLKLIILLTIIIFTFYFTAFIVTENSNSYKEPQEAILADDTASGEDFLLIPGYKVNDKALFFFIKDKNKLGAVYVEKGIFGWKTGMFTSGQFSKDVGRDKLEDIHGHGGNLIFGLIRDVDNRLITIGENDAKVLKLAMLPPNVVEEFRLEGLYIWYFESDRPLDERDIKLINKSTGEELHSEDI